jgi:hypothetical protein
MSDYKFGEPFVHENWYIFPHTTLDNIKLDDCPGSVTGTCINTATVEDCAKICRDIQPCFAGYFIETPDKHNICVPIRKIAGGPSIGPYYRLRNKDIYPELKNMKSYVFTDKTSYPYPPDHSNNIFYTDRFVLTDLDTNKSIGSDNNILSDKSIYLQFLPQEVMRSYFSQYLIVKNGDEVVINIPDTAYILANNNESLNWVMKIVSIGGENSTLRIFTSSKNKKIGDFLDYTDNLYFMIGNQPVVFEDGLLKISSSGRQDPVYFKIIPKIEVYYCNKDNCSTVMLEDTEMKGGKSRYKGIIVHRNPNCWGSCDKQTKKSSLLWIILALFIIGLIFVIMYRVRYSGSL